jgi:hypothetical protein
LRVYRLTIEGNQGHRFDGTYYNVHGALMFERKCLPCLHQSAMQYLAAKRGHLQPAIAAETHLQPLPGSQGCIIHGSGARF